MYRFIFSIFLFSCFNNLNGQIISDPATIKSTDESRHLVFEQRVDIGTNYYILYRNYRTEFTINGTTYKSNFGCELCKRNIIVKYKKSNNEFVSFKEITVNDQGISGIGLIKMQAANDRVFLLGNTKGGNVVEGKEIDTIGNSIGTLFEFDEDLNYKRRIDFGARCTITGIVYNKNQYVIGGYFHGDKLKYKDYIIKNKYNNVSSDMREAFLMKIDAESLSPIEGFSFGGPGNTTIDRMNIDNSGNLLLTGESNEFVFVYRDTSFNTSEYPYNNSTYVMSVDFDFNLLCFNEIDSDSSILLSDLKFDNLGNIYYLATYFNTFRVNNSEVIDSVKQKYYKGLIKFDKNGKYLWHKGLPLHWLTTFEFSDEGNILLSGPYRDTIYIDGVRFLKNQYNSKYNVLLLELNKDNGVMNYHHRVGGNMPFNVLDFKKVEENKFTFFADILVQSYFPYIEMDSIFINAKENDASYLIFNYELLTNNSSEEEYESIINNINVYPNPAKTNEIVNIEFDLKNKFQGYIGLYDAIGNKKSINFIENTDNFICSDCMAGLYYIVIQKNSRSISIPLIIN